MRNLYKIFENCKKKIVFVQKQRDELSFQLLPTSAGLKVAVGLWMICSEGDCSKLCSAKAA